MPPTSAGTLAALLLGMNSLSLGRGFASVMILGVSLAVGCESSSSDESAEGAGGAGGNNETCTMGTSGSMKEECVDPAVILGQGGGTNDGGGGAAQGGGGGASADGGGGGAAPGTCPSVGVATDYFRETNEFLMFVTAIGTSPNADGECCYRTTNTFCH